MPSKSASPLKPSAWARVMSQRPGQLPTMRCTTGSLSQRIDHFPDRHADAGQVEHRALCKSVGREIVRPDQAFNGLARGKQPQTGVHRHRANRRFVAQRFANDAAGK